jgi:hypothetical protein
VVYSIQLYVIKFVSNLRQVGGFLRVLQFPPPVKIITLEDKKTTQRDEFRFNFNGLILLQDFSIEQHLNLEKKHSLTINSL